MPHLKTITIGIGQAVKITLIYSQKLEQNILVHVEETTGVYVNSNSGAEVSWFGPKWTCQCTEGSGTNFYTCSGGGDAFLLGLTKSQHWTGAWCDFPKDRKYPFICEGLI